MANKRGRPKGSQNRLTKNLKDAILGALKAKGGQRYLEKIAENDPRTFCALLARVLPMVVAGDADNPITYRVQLDFGSGENDLQASIPGPAFDEKTLVHMRCP